MTPFFANRQIFHITWVTHNSRTSDRMIAYNVKQGEALFLSDDDQIKITQEIANIVKEDGLHVFSYNILTDHIHIILVCAQDQLPNIVRKLKGKSAQKFKQHLGIPKEETFHLWAQKYNYWQIESDHQLSATIEYIVHNRIKHGLHENLELQKIIKGMIQPINFFLE